MRVAKLGFASRWLMVDAMLRPSCTAKDPVYADQPLGFIFEADDLTGGQKSSCMSTTIRADLIVPSGAILNQEGAKKEIGYVEVG